MAEKCFKTDLLKLLLVLLPFSAVSAKEYAGAEFRTKEAFTYGRFEVKYKAAYGSGILSTFFTYHDNDPEWLEHWNEIDIEIMGVHDREIQVNSITPGHGNHVAHMFAEFDPYHEYHTYAFEWTPDHVAWFVDGVEKHRQTGEHIATLVYDQKIMMNVWQPADKNWAGDFSDLILPAFAFYDWVSYYDYTPGEGDSGTENNFTLRWKDEFDSWNTDRWEKATHTFDTNNVDFVPENVVFKDGKLILCITQKTFTGYTDYFTPSILQSKWLDGELLLYLSEDIDENTLEGAVITVDGSPATEVNYFRQNRMLTVRSAVRDAEETVLFINGISDLFSRTLNRTFTLQPTQDNISFPLKINVGGQAQGNYLADLSYPENHFGSPTGETYFLTVPNNVSGTADPELFRSFRQNLVHYAVNVPPGTYSVLLMFAEHYFTETERRIFDIYAENTLIEADVDIYAERGLNNALYVTIPVISVEDRTLDLWFMEDRFSSALLNVLTVDRISTGLRGDNGNGIPEDFGLTGYPNPFNGETRFTFSLPEPAQVKFSLFTLQGQKVTELAHSEYSAGEHLLNWTLNEGSGVYFAVLDINNDPLMRRVFKCTALK